MQSLAIGHVMSDGLNCLSMSHKTSRNNQIEQHYRRTVLKCGEPVQPLQDIEDKTLLKLLNNIVLPLLLLLVNQSFYCTVDMETNFYAFLCQYNGGDS